jgi:hypothetical protein
MSLLELDSSTSQRPSQPPATTSPSASYNCLVVTERLTWAPQVLPGYSSTPHEPFSALNVPLLYIPIYRFGTSDCFSQPLAVQVAKWLVGVIIFCAVFSSLTLSNNLSSSLSLRTSNVTSLRRMRADVSDLVGWEAVRFSWPCNKFRCVLVSLGVAQLRQCLQLSIHGIGSRAVCVDHDVLVGPECDGKRKIGPRMLYDEHP